MSLVWNYQQVYLLTDKWGDPNNLHVYADQQEFKNEAPDLLENGVTYVKNVVWPELLLNE